jgi:hypothetical protein
VELVEDREQGVADQGVNLVQEEDHRTRTAFAPGCEVGPQSPLGGDLREVRGGRRPQLGRQLSPAILVEGEEHRADASFDVVAGDAAGLATGEDGGVASLGGQGFGEQSRRRRFAALARRVNDEPGFPVDQQPQLGEAALRLDHVVLVGAANAGDVEETLHAPMIAQGQLVCMAGRLKGAGR